MRFAGESWQSKVAKVRKELEDSNLYGMVVTEVAVSSPTSAPTLALLSSMTSLPGF